MRIPRLALIVAPVLLVFVFTIVGEDIAYSSQPPRILACSPMVLDQGQSDSTKEQLAENRCLRAQRQVAAVTPITLPHGPVIPTFGPSAMGGRMYGLIYPAPGVQDPTLGIYDLTNGWMGQTHNVSGASLNGDPSQGVMLVWTIGAASLKPMVYESPTKDGALWIAKPYTPWGLTPIPEPSSFTLVAADGARFRFDVNSGTFTLLSGPNPNARPTPFPREVTP